MKPAELRRSYEELVDAHRLLEAENQKLKAEVTKLRRGDKPEPPPKVPTTPRVGHIVTYVDKAGHVHNALVLKVIDDQSLKLKVFRTARADLILEAVRAKVAMQRNCWRMR